MTATGTLSLDLDADTYALKMFSTQFFNLNFSGGVIDVTQSGFGIVSLEPTANPAGTAMLNECLLTQVSAAQATLFVGSLSLTSGDQEFDGLFIAGNTVQVDS